MNYNELLINYIDTFPVDEPITIDEIKKYFIRIVGKNNDNITKVMKNIYVYINRLIKDEKLILFTKGVYYKPIIGIFGNKKLNVNKVIEKKYLKCENVMKGYITGAYLYNKLGLTTQVPNTISIVTNECPNHNEYNNKVLNVKIRRPKIKINNDNFLYLQLLDLLNNKEKVKIEVDDEKKIIFNFIKDNSLDIENIFYYAKITNNKKAIDKLYDLG